MPEWCPQHEQGWQGVLDGAERWVGNGKGPESPGWSVQTRLRGVGTAHPGKQWA